nr:NACHT domain-containing protein [uncultured Pseudomonas sp.]
MSLELAAVGSIAKAFSPILSDIYKNSKSTLQKHISAWKAGGESESLERYISSISNIKTLWSMDEAKSIDLFYYPSRLGRSQNLINNIDELGDGSFVIEGIVGQGKSVFMRHLALSALKSPSGQKIPLLVELRYVSEKNSLTKILCTKLGMLGASDDPDVLEYLLQKNKITLLLDGFDEIEPKLLKETTTTIVYFQAAYPKLKIIVSSRPYNDIQNVAGFEVVALDKLRPKDHEPFLRKLGVDTNRIAEIVGAIQSSPTEIQEAISTPLMMTLVVLVYKSENQIPPHLAKFFSVLFHVVFIQHDAKKDMFRRVHNSGLSESELQELFEAFCFSVTQKGYGRTISREKFNECYRQAQQLAPACKTNSCDFKSDIVNVACLMLEEGVGELTFLHKGILDFFTAAFISKLNIKSSEKFYAKASVNYEHWKGALQFLSTTDQYRFGKFYLLEPVKKDYIELKGILESDNSLSLINYIDSLFSKAYSRKGPSGGEVASFITTVETEFKETAAHKISKSWPHRNFATMSLEATKALILETKGASFEIISEREITFGLRSTLLTFGMEKIRISLLELCESYEKILNDALLRTLQEEKRQKIIDMNFD